MIVRDPDLLIKLHEEIGYCELCDRTDLRLEVHHIWAKGMGGGSRMDVGFNLIVLCKPCHDAAHRGEIEKRVLFGIAGEREVHRMRRG